MEKGDWKVPALQPCVQLGVVCAEDKDNVEPAFREQVTAMIVHDHTTICHLLIQLIHHLQDRTQSQFQHLTSTFPPLTDVKHIYCHV